MPAVAVVVAVGEVQADQGPVVAAVAMGAGGLSVPGQLRADGQLDRPARPSAVPTWWERAMVST